LKIAIDYLLVFSHFWFATPQLVLQADWQEVWHSPQPPFLALSHRLRVSRVLILSIICISDLLNSNGFPGRPPADSHLKTGKILAYHPYKVKIFQQFGYWEKVKQKMPCFFNKLFCVILYILGSAKRPPAKVPPVAYALSCYFRAIFVCYACVFLLNMNGREQHALRRHPLGQRRVRTAPA